ncbi:MAG: aspartate aminotransferase family protein [Alphaproteobacteria bacterium]|nr:aspartate aminotransferase family protein [Alphaproteobacteria bacterium]MBT4018573.1 aspartate aminotransferase family protein [Alphaproteobacteria bacterium]MBT5158345.1 aspartate aminotransferase family protein [Alphaproteobacteria bacterium]MBT5918920.1 aspartate aminotransferase family protein [Alphaproteobacteria bacterium]MBT6385848.1 aspartate aminotransferase family protein [Alphaproteobacteria bacterium]
MMTHVFHRQTKADLPVAARGDGIWITDTNGKKYLDGSGGAAVSSLGHSDAAVRQAMITQMNSMPFAHSGFFTTDVMEKLADKLTSNAPGDLNHVYFLSGGSEAVEAAIKLARQYFLEAGQPNKQHFIARRQSYHGNTLGALSAGGNQFRRAPYEPLLMDVDHISPCYAWRDQRVSETETDYGLRVADELEDAILARGPETVAAFIVEPVVGATLGAVTPVPGYFKRIREICDRYGVLLIMDEVMCGMGRTGSMYACEQEGVVPDMIAIAKGLGAGYQPIGALLVSDNVFQAVQSGSGAFQHGHTYMGHAVACAAALAVQEQIEERSLLAAVVDRGDDLDRALVERFGNHRFVGNIRGRGLFRAIELVADRETKAPFDPGLNIHAAIKAAAMERGLMCYPMGGTIDGRLGDHVLLAPAFIIEKVEIEDLADRLADAVEAVTADLSPGQGVTDWQGSGVAA